MKDRYATMLEDSCRKLIASQSEQGLQGSLLDEHCRGLSNTSRVWRYDIRSLMQDYEGYSSSFQLLDSTLKLYIMLLRTGLKGPMCPIVVP